MADLTALTTAMTTTGLIDPAAKAALTLGPREWPKLVRIEVAPAGAQAVKLSVVVNPALNSLKQTEPAGALMRELISRAKAVVSQSAEGRREEIKQRLDEIEKRRGELRASIESIRKRLKEAEAHGSRRGFDEPLADQRRRIDSELSDKRARLLVMKEILPKTDEMGTALQGLVAARTALVAGLEKAVGEGRGDALELLRARAELAESRVRLAEWGDAPSSSRSRTARDERIHLEIDVAALEARLKTMPPTETPKPAAEDAQEVRSELFRTENESRSLETQYQQVRRDYDQIASPPTLVLLDGQPQ
jgi:chromosome segregation ATPase